MRSNSREFKIYIVLRKIIEFVLADKVYKCELKPFKELIERFINGYIQLFDDTLPFKVHHLEHYPDAILEFGLLSNVSTLSSERTLQLLTRSIESSRNSMNLPLSIAKAFTFKIESLFNLEVISEISKIPSNYEQFFNNLNSDQRISDLRSITIENTKIDKSELYLIKVADEKFNLPVFIKILKIYYTNNKPIIIGRIVVARSFIFKYHAYGIQYTEEIVKININQILHHKSLCCYTYRGQYFAIRNFHVHFYLNQ